MDSRLSEKRNMEAAKKFFKQAVGVVGHVQGSGDDGWPYVLSAGNTRDDEQQRTASDEHVSQ